MIDVTKMSTAGILKLHRAIAEALSEDDQLPDSKKKYGVREYQDWREFADMFERELDSRNDSYERIPW